MSFRFLLVLVLVAESFCVFAQDDSPPPPTLARNRFRNGEETLRAFLPVSQATRSSIVKLNVDGETVALGCVVDSAGLALTKASEIKKGKLTCWLASEREVSAEVLAVDEDEDVALIRVDARNLKPIRWSNEELAIGQWAITPGVAETPHAVGIISALPRRIRPPRAYIGVQFDITASTTRIDQVRPGLGAEKAGLKSGDIITSVNGEAVTNREQVVDILREFREGQKVKLGVARTNDHFTAEVLLMSPNADPNGDSFFPQQRATRMAGNLSQRAEGFAEAIEHDTVLQPWLCGGPLVNLDGKAIGLNIARAGRVSTYALPAKLVTHIIEDLKTKYRQATARS